MDTFHTLMFYNNYVGQNQFAGYPENCVETFQTGGMKDPSLARDCRFL